MNNFAPANGIIETHRLHSEGCACRISPPARGSTAEQMLKAWLKDHPDHIRKEHLAAKEFCKWFDRRLNGRRSKCSR